MTSPAPAARSVQEWTSVCFLSFVLHLFAGDLGEHGLALPKCFCRCKSWCRQRSLLGRFDNVTGGASKGVVLFVFFGIQAFTGECAHARFTLKVVKLGGVWFEKSRPTFDLCVGGRLARRVRCGVGCRQNCAQRKRSVS